MLFGNDLSDTETPPDRSSDERVDLPRGGDHAERQREISPCQSINQSIGKVPVTLLPLLIVVVVVCFVSYLAVQEAKHGRHKGPLQAVGSDAQIEQKDDESITRLDHLCPGDVKDIMNAKHGHKEERRPQASLEMVRARSKLCAQHAKNVKQQKQVDLV